MTRMLTVLFALVTTTSLSAGELQSLGTDGTTVADLLRSLRVARAERRASGVVKPDIVSVDWTKEAFIIPVAGNLQGGNGTFFKSDVTIANRRAQPQIISVGFLRRGVNNGSAPVQNFSIPANFTSIERDFIGNKLQTTGLGTLLVVARTTTGTNAPIDNNAHIDGFSRIWTPQPGSTGSVSQNFESIDLEDSLADSWGYGLRQDEAFRTNVGLVNLNDTAINFTVQVVGLRGNTTFPVTVQPYSMEQPSLPAGIYGDLFIFVSASGGSWWSAYGTSVDNVTGDGWVSHVH